MNGPHGLDCQTSTIKLVCRECGEQIYLFRCSHGSIVLFDALGGSWPRHDHDRAWAESLTRRTGSDGSTIVEVAPDVEAHRPPSREFRPQDDEQVFDVTRPLGTAQDEPIVRMDPPPRLRGVHTVAGRLAEIVPDRDPLGDLRLEPGTVGSRHVPVSAECLQVTIHCVTEHDHDAIESFTAYIDEDVLDGARHGEAVLADLVAVRGAGGVVVWCVEDLFQM